MANIEKNSISNFKIILLVILITAVAFILGFFINTEIPLSVRPAGPPTPKIVYKIPEPRVYDLDMLKSDSERPEASSGVKPKPSDIIEAKEWRSADPEVKKGMIEELDANIANSKKTLEINPDDILAKRILLMSERRKRIETEKFDGKYPGEDMNKEGVDAAAAR